MSRHFQEMGDAVSEELGLKLRYLGRSGEPLRNAWDYTTDAVSARLQPVTRDFNQAYRRNEFYMKDICEGAQQLHQDLW